MIENKDIDKRMKKIDENLDVLNERKKEVVPVLEQQRIIQETTLPILEMQQSIIETIPKVPKISIQMDSIMPETITNIQSNNFLTELGVLAIKSTMPSYQFEIPGLKNIELISDNIISSFSAGLTALIQNPVMQQIQTISSSIGQWLQTVDFSPLINILEDIRSIGFDHNYDQIYEIFLKAMFDARWFPYAGWIADFRIVGDLVEILNTSRVSKNRVKRIDRLIFSYYSKGKIDNFKRNWRKLDLPPYMIRILIQSIQAYRRREYALTVATLSTLWEGIIQEKAQDKGYRVSKRTRQNLTKLIDVNEYDKIFSSFCEEFIFYDCNSPEQVRDDVPGRHGIAHCWYDKYPSRKMALNAIIFTDFLLQLEPIEKEGSN